MSDYSNSYYVFLCAITLAGALGFFAVSACIYVAFKFLSLAISLDAALLREFKVQNQHDIKMDANNPITSDKLKSFIASRFTPTDGDFVPYSDEEAFLNERVAELRAKGLTDEELQSFIKQAVGTDIGNE
jgi:hypothetical protein